MKLNQLGILLVIVVSTVKTAPTPKEVDSFKLPRTSIPLRYDLTLITTVLVRREFTGIVIIYIEMTDDSDTITLHSKGLAVQSVNLTDSSSEEIIQTHSFDEDKDFINIQSMSRQLLKGEKLTVEIAFSGLTQLNMLGFYRSSYKVNTSIR
jgi:aminopeptidase 2